MSKNLFIDKRFKSLLASNLFSCFCYTVSVTINTIITGFLFGEKALAAVEIFNSPIYFVEFFGLIFGSGGAILYGKASGNFDKEKMSKIFSLSTESVLIISLVSAIIMRFGSLAYINFFPLDEESLKYALSYSKYFYLFLLVHPFKIFLNRFVILDGDDKLSVFSSIIYIILGILLPISFGKLIGISGIILGSIIAVAITTLILITHFFLKKNTFRFKLTTELSLIKDFVKYSFLDSSVALYASFTELFIQRFILWKFNTSVLAIYSVISCFLNLQTSFDAVGSSLNPIYDSYEGEHNEKNLRYATKLGFKASAYLAFVFFILIYLLAPLIVKLFGVEDLELVKQATHALKIVNLSSLFASYIFYISSYYLLSNKIKLACTIAFICNVLCAVLVLPIFAFLFGINGLWFSFVATPVITLILLFIYVSMKDGIKAFPFYFKNYDESKIYVKSMIINKENLNDLWSSAKEFLIKNNIDIKTTNKILLLFEELPLIIKDKNNKPVLVEFNIVIEEDISVVIRDDGRLFDIIDEDSRLESFREFITSCLISKIEEKDSLTTLGCNRSLFKFKKGDVIKY